MGYKKCGTMLKCSGYHRLSVYSLPVSATVLKGCCITASSVPPELPQLAMMAATGTGTSVRRYGQTAGQPDRQPDSRTPKQTESIISACGHSMHTGMVHLPDTHAHCTSHNTYPIIHTQATNLPMNNQHLMNNKQPNNKLMQLYCYPRPRYCGSI